MAEQESKQLLGQRLEFTATIGPRTITGVFGGGLIETVALEDLRRADTGEHIADQVLRDVGNWTEDGSDYSLNVPHIVSVSGRE